MKKLIKWSLIFGFIICLLGVGMITAGTMMGGGKGCLSYLRTHQYSLGWFGDVDIRGRERIWRAADTATLHETDQGEGDVITGIRELEIEAGPGTMEIYQEARADSQDTSIRIVHENGDVLRYQIYQDRETLKIELPEGLRRMRDGWRMETLTIYVPEGYRYREINIETLAGEFYADALYADTLELESKAGSITIMDGQAGNLEADCLSGEIECMARVENSADADCKAGRLSFAMAHGKDQYDYDLTCKTGSITLIDEEEETYTGLWQKNYIDHRTGKTVELDCAAGAITVHYPESF